MNTDPPEKKKASPPPAAAPPEGDEEELAHYDDAVIGRAFRWSLVAFVVIASVAGATVYWIKRKPAPAAAKVTKLTAPAPRAVAGAEVPEAKFTDITAAAGIKFMHANGAYGDKLLPETMGGGVAFLDFDGDGDQDLLFINSTDWPGRTPGGKQPTTMALYRNDSHGRFEDATAGSGLDVSFYGMGAAAGDYDNDGRPDVFITAVGENHLFHNQGNGKFVDVTPQAGVGGSAK